MKVAKEETKSFASFATDRGHVRRPGESGSKSNAKVRKGGASRTYILTLMS